VKRPGPVAAERLRPVGRRHHRVAGGFQLMPDEVVRFFQGVSRLPRATLIHRTVRKRVARDVKQVAPDTICGDALKLIVD